MIRHIWTVLCLGALAPLSAGATPKIAVHVESGGWFPETWPLCSAMVSDIYNDQIGTYNGSDGVIGAYYVVSLFAEDTEPGFTGVSFGIAYNPLVLRVDWVYFGHWYEQRTEETTFNWPAPWSGVRLKWADCQNATVAGQEEEGPSTFLLSIAVYVERTTALYITDHPVDGEQVVINCDGTETVLPDSALGRAGFGIGIGFNPCTGSGVLAPVPEYPSVPDPPLYTTPPPPPPPPPPPVPPLSPPAVLLHVSNTPHPADSCQADFSGKPVITEASLNPTDNPHVVYLLAVPEGATEPDTGYGVTGVQMGIQYPGSNEQHRGLRVLDWHRCSDLDFPSDDWPGPGSSNTITWAIDNCKRGDLMPAGYFTVSAYDPSVMSIIPFPPSGLIKVATCGGAEVNVEQAIDPKRAGWISLGGGAVGSDNNGCNPLLEPCISASPTRSATWGKIKAMFGGH